MRRNWCFVLAVLTLTAPACNSDSKSSQQPRAAKKERPVGQAPIKAKDRPPKAAEPAPPAAPAPDPAVLARGKYLVEVVANCASCHTPIGAQGPDMSKRFAGGMEMAEKFGTWRSPNITQDKKTGIGDWTDDQILAAIREGKRPDGTHLYPIMPYLMYNALSNDDGKAMVAYLRTIAPIENAVAGNTDLKLPQVPAPAPAGKAPPADNPVAQGAYLATLMHCVMCHTPFGADGMPDMSKAFAGGYEFEMPPVFGTGVLYSPNITSDKKTGIGKYTDDQITAAITQLKKADGKPIFGPMMILGTSWSKLAPDDLAHLLAFIRQIPPVDNKVPASTFKPAGPPPGGQPG